MRDFTYEQKVMMYRLGWYVVPRHMFDGPTFNWDTHSWIKAIDLFNAWRAP